MSESSEELLRMAIQAENIGDLADAFEMYNNALASLFADCKIEKDASRKVLIQRLIEKYIVIAESLKIKIEGSKPAEVSKEIQISLPAKSKPQILSKNADILQGKSNTFRPDFYDYTAEAKKKQTTKPSIGSVTSFKKNPVKKNSTTNTKENGSIENKSSKLEPKMKVNEDKKHSEYENQLLEEILDSSPCVKWDDIAGLAVAKQTLHEAVILPNLRPDLFTGLRSPARGVLLFGPPGTGKTLLAKAVATESGFVFFSITSSSVTSKYLGEGEKLMRALFSLARERQPAVIFLDEMDALLSVRKENEHEASRRIKTEFMTQVDGAATSGADRLLIMGATNIPWEIDEAVLRRLAKRVYVPLPDAAARRALILRLFSKHGGASAAPTAETESAFSFVKRVAGLSGDGEEADLQRVLAATDGYSGSDLSALCHEAAMLPIRELGLEALRTVRAEAVRPLRLADLLLATGAIKPSVSPGSLAAYSKWADQYGTRA